MARKSKWKIYIPDDGHWTINGVYSSKSEARKAFLKQYGKMWDITRLPNGSHISRDEPGAK